MYFASCAEVISSPLSLPLLFVSFLVRHKIDVGKAIKLCFYFLFFPWHTIIPYCEPDRHVRDGRIAGGKDLRRFPSVRLSRRYDCSQQIPHHFSSLIKPITISAGGVREGKKMCGDEMQQF